MLLTRFDGIAACCNCFYAISSNSTVEHAGIFYIHIVLYSYLRGEEDLLEMMMGER